MSIKHSLQNIAIVAIVASVIGFIALSRYITTSPSITYSRFQLGGFSIGHFLFFLMVGIAYPDYGWWALAIGIAFEFMEWVISYGLSMQQQERVLNIIGGRFPNGGFRSPTHWLDRHLFGEYPTTHWWHPKVTDVIMNILGFLLGRWLIQGINK